MKYCSVRGLEKDISFKDVLFRGYAKDGGLYMPQTIPFVSEDKLKEMKKFSYSEVVKMILRLFIDESEISTDDLNSLVKSAHSQFEIPEIIKFAKLNEDLLIAELFHGETLTFKDLALSVVGRLFEYFLKQNNKHTIILVGTSGDTGSSAISSVRGLQGIDIIVLYPKNNCTKIQELQMITFTDSNVHCFAVDGSSDELDAPIKKCFADFELVVKHNISSLNSINWSRIAVQIAHYFYLYLQLCSQDESLEVIVPSGAAGNLTAGLLANLMGLPITLVASTNSNKCVSEFLRRGEIKTGNKAHPTLAPAMDIQMPYNLERLVFLVSNGDFKLLESFGSAFDNNRNIKLPDIILNKLKEVIIDAESFSDDVITNTIRKCWQENSYRVCPHTATAVAYHYKHKKTRGSIRVCLATASADKFPDALISSQVPPNINSKIECLFKLDKKFVRMQVGENWFSILKNKIEEIGNQYSVLAS
uniref:Threonine synthase-like 2 n=1 Tax=Strigamia maritima TaxID=126957 RepID=T1IHH2_STRMM